MTTRKEPSFIGSLFGNTQVKPANVDAVMDTFHKTIADLESISVAENAKADEKTAQAAALVAEANASVAEAMRASSIADKMKAIFV